MSFRCLAYALAIASSLSGCAGVAAPAGDAAPAGEDGGSVSDFVLRTQGIALIATVRATRADQALVHVELLLGGDESNTYVLVDGGDHLFVDVGGETIELQAAEAGVYEAQVGTGDGDTPFVIRLEREEEEDALETSGTLPAAFEITSDFGTPPPSRAEDLELAWAPSGEPDDMKLEIADDTVGGCIFDYQDDLGADPGTYTLAAGSLEGRSSTTPLTCEVTATLIRSRLGDTDRALDPESHLVLEQARSVTFVSAP